MVLDTERTISTDRIRATVRVIVRATAPDPPTGRETETGTGTGGQFWAVGLTD